MATPPRMTSSSEAQPSAARRLVRWLIGIAAAIVVLFVIAVLNNNYSLRHRSRAEFNSQFDRAIESSTQWIVQHPKNYGNPPLMFMVGDMAEMSGDPRLRNFVQGYLASDRVNLPGVPMTYDWAHWADPSVPVPEIPLAEASRMSWQNRWFGYASAPDRIPLTPADRTNLFSPTKYSWGERLHIQLLALDIYRRFNGTSPELEAVINPVAEGVARDAFWDFRVTDAYYQRSAFILGAGRPDLVRSRWIDRILDAQRPDGSWNFCWHGWCRGLLEFRRGEDDPGHSTVQAAWALYQIKYRYANWIERNYR